jgi:predicted Rossmann fold flavoprotein
MNKIDTIIIGAGAAGLMCAIEAGKRGKRVLILDKTNKVGKKILMSGGGRCNFTNLYIEPERYLSHNEHFCKSALSRYTQWDFIGMVERHGIAYFEKTLGQLFCVEKSSQIVDMLLTACQNHQIKIQLNQHINAVNQSDQGFIVDCNQTQYLCKSLVVASGGLSIPTLGSSPFGYQLAQQFGLHVYPTRAGLVPFTLHDQDKQHLETLSGISIDALTECNHQSFRENMLFTHRGLSGPAMLQISSYWHPGDELNVSLLPDVDIVDMLQTAQQTSPDCMLKTVLSKLMAKRLLSVFYTPDELETPMKQFHPKVLHGLAQRLQAWRIKPNATEGYRTAEVTLGGVDCNELSSQTFETKKIPGLYFIGEVLDVSGWLGGYNFQWAWSSGWAAGQVV